MASGNPDEVRLLGYVVYPDEEAARRVEARVHRIFKRFRKAREWFVPSKEVLRFARALAGGRRAQTTADIAALLENIRAGLMTTPAPPVSRVPGLAASKATPTTSLRGAKVSRKEQMRLWPAARRKDQMRLWAEDDDQGPDKPSGSS